MKSSKVILALALTVASSVSLAQTHRRATTTPATSSYNSSYSSGNEHRMAISGGLGFYAPGAAAYTGKFNGGAETVVSPAVSGLFGISGDFDYFLNNEMSVGGTIRYYSTSDTAAGTEFTNGLFTLGATFKAHVIDTATWAGYAETGLGVISPTYKAGTAGSIDTSMGFGLYLGMGLLYKINDGFAIGLENLRMMGLGEKINGWPLDDFMIKARFFIGG